MKLPRILAAITMVICSMALLVFSARPPKTQTAYEKKVFPKCKAAFSRLFKSELRPENVREVNAAGMSKFASSLTKETIADLPCDLKNIIKVIPGTVDPSPIALEIVGVKVEMDGKRMPGDKAIMYVPTQPTADCTPHSPGTFVFGASECKEVTNCYGKDSPDCECDCATACYEERHICSRCEKSPSPSPSAR